MGSDKALLSLGSRTLLQHALQVATSVSPRPRIVGAKEKYNSFGEVVEDLYPGCGPLGGIHAALSTTETDLNLLLPVDMPLMTPEFLGWLLRQAEASSESIIMPDALGGPQPLCAVYRRRLQPVAEAALRRGDYKIRRVFAEVPTRILAEQEIIAAGFSPEVFRNVNTVEEFAALARQNIGPGDKQREAIADE